MSELDSYTDLERRLRNAAEALERVAAEPESGERERVRDEIVAIFHAAETLIVRVAELKEEIRPLVERYRSIFPAMAPAPRAAAPGGSRPSRRVDHLGSSTHLERGWNAIAGADYANALRELERALEMAPGDPRAQALRAWALMRLERLEDARAALEEVLTRNPDEALARTNLGYVHLREKRFGESIEHLSRALRTGTDRTATLYATLYMGMVYAEREMFRDAVGFLERAISDGPNLIEAYWELGRAHLRAGEPARALDAWRRGAEANRFNAWGERCREAAEQLESGRPVDTD